MTFDEVTASNLVKVDLAGRKVMDSPYEINPAGFLIHSAIHAASISADDLRIAGGILLFLASREMIGQFNRPAPSPAVPPKRPAVAPLAIPTIVTPWGVTAILFL
jgi:small neutral amino acid transporter SnatA (MarC family)